MNQVLPQSIIDADKELKKLVAQVNAPYEKIKESSHALKKALENLQSFYSLPRSNGLLSGSGLPGFLEKQKNFANDYSSLLSSDVQCKLRESSAGLENLLPSDNLFLYDEEKLKNAEEKAYECLSLSVNELAESLKCQMTLLSDIIERTKKEELEILSKVVSGISGLKQVASDTLESSEAQSKAAGCLSRVAIAVSGITLLVSLISMIYGCVQSERSEMRREAALSNSIERICHQISANSSAALTNANQRNQRIIDELSLEIRKSAMILKGIPIRTTKDSMKNR